MLLRLLLQHRNAGGKRRRVRLSRSSNVNEAIKLNYDHPSDMSLILSFSPSSLSLFLPLSHRNRTISQDLDTTTTHPFKTRSVRETSRYARITKTSSFKRPPVSYRWVSYTYSLKTDFVGNTIFMRQRKYELNGTVPCFLILLVLANINLNWTRGFIVY